jgi:hypothetical protein
MEIPLEQEAKEGVEVAASKNEINKNNAVVDEDYSCSAKSRVDRILT